MRTSGRTLVCPASPLAASAASCSHARALRHGAALPAAPAPEGGSLLEELCWGPWGFCWARGAGAAGVPGRLAAVQEALRLDGLR